jgi:hypothetical protein
MHLLVLGCRLDEEGCGKLVVVGREPMLGDYGGAGTVGD